MNKIFKMEAEGDTIYIQAETEDKARAELTEAVGPIPDNLVKVTELAELPEGEALLNPTAD